MRIAEIALFTEQPDEVIEFYERVLEAAPESRWPGGAIFDLGGAKLLIHVTGEAAEGQPPNVDHFASASATSTRPHGGSARRRATTTGAGRPTYATRTDAWSS